MRWEKNIRKNGASFQIILPKALVEYLELDENDTIIIQDDNGRHGKFVSIWKKGVADDSETTE